MYNVQPQTREDDRNTYTQQFSQGCSCACTSVCIHVMYNLFYCSYMYKECFQVPPSLSMLNLSLIRIACMQCRKYFEMERSIDQVSDAAILD